MIKLKLDVTYKFDSNHFIQHLNMFSYVDIFADLQPVNKNIK